MIEPIIFCICSIAIFFSWLQFHRKFPFALFNPLLLSVISVVLILFLLEIDYSRYMTGGEWISAFIEPGVVALGYPLYKQMHLISRLWRTLIGACCLASLCALTINVLFAKALGIDEWAIRSLATLNITTAIAMETSAEIGGSAALAAVAVMIAGFTGSAFGMLLMSVLKIKNMRAVGLAFGSASHALGAATIARTSMEASAYASTALILCAIVTAIVAPIYIPFLLSL